MYKPRNTGTWKGSQGTRRMGERHIPANVAKYSGECCQTFQEMLPNILENILKHSGEFC